MSSWAESEARSRSFFERIARKEPKNTSCLEGISKRIWVAYQRKCYIPVTSHRNSLRDPANRFAFCAFTSFLTRWKFDSAQDDRLIICQVVFCRNIYFLFDGDEKWRWKIGGVWFFYAERLAIKRNLWYNTITTNYAPLAQLDRAQASDAWCRRFESAMVCQKSTCSRRCFLFFILLHLLSFHWSFLW